MTTIMLEYTPPTILLGGTSEVFITHVVDPSHFHCQLTESSTKLDLLMDELHHYCTSPEAQEDEGLRFVLGEPCLAQYSGDQGWYRVIITGILQKNGLVEVSFVDYGNNEILSRGSLKKMKPEFMELPIQAIQCGLAYIESRQGFWSPEHTAQFEDLILEKTFKSKFISLLEGDSVCCVELSDNTGKNINLHFGQMTGTLKSEGGPRVVAPGSGDNMNITALNDLGGGEPRRPYGTEGGPSRSFGGRESERSGGGRTAFGDRSARKPHGMEDGDYGAAGAGGDGWGRNSRARGDRPAFSGGDRQPFSGGDRQPFSDEGRQPFSGGDRQPFTGGRKPDDRGPGGRGFDDWSEGDGSSGGGGGGNSFGGGQSSGRKSFPNGHDDRCDVDYNEASAGRKSNQTNQQGNTWASGFGRTSNDRSNSGGSGSPPSTKAESLSSLTLALGESLEVYVAYVVTPANFWCQLSKNTEEIDQLMEKLNAYYGGLPPSENLLKNAKEGSVCAAQYSDDNRWYRGIIRQKEWDKCEVQFVDYGNADFVPASGLKTLAPSFLSLPVQAIKCGLNSVAMLAEEWSDASIQKFEELTLDQPLNCKIISAGQDGLTLVELINPSNGVVIGDELIKLELAKGRKASAPRTAPAPTRSLKPETVSASKTSEFIEQNFGNGQKTDVVVSWMISPEAFWCQLVGQNSQIENLSRNLQTQYARGGSRSLSAGTVQKGMPLVAKFSEDGCWYRGQVVDAGSSQVQVHFVDYGNQETVALSSLQQPHDSTMTTPKLAVKCILKDVKPATGNRWSEKTVSYLETVIADQATCIFQGKQGDAYLVDLIARGKNVADELEKVGLGKKPGGQTMSSAAATFPTTPLVEAGQQVAVFVTSIDSVNSFWCQPAFATEIDLETVYSSPAETVSSPSIGTACVTKFSQDGFWYRAEVIQRDGSEFVVRFVDYGNTEKVSATELKTLKPEFSKIPPQCFHCSLNGLPTVNSADMKKKFVELTLEKEIQAIVTKRVGDTFSLEMNESGKSINQHLLSMCSQSGPAVSPPEADAAYLPVPNLSGQSLKAYVSATISLDEFYIQRADSQADLDKMTATMKSSSSCSPLTDVKPGQACAVKYPEDEGWYRGKVKSVSGGTATVLFIDYGNSEQISLNGIRMILAEVLEVPPLAYPCSLIGLKPVSGKWSSEALTMFEDTIMDKELTATFVTSREVKITSPDGDVCDLLVKAGFAEGAQSQRPTADRPQSGKSVTAAMKHYPPIKLPGKRVVGYLTHVDRSGLSIQPTEWTDQINSIVERLETLSAALEEQTGLTNLDLNAACCAKFSEDNAWYRGLVTEVGKNVTIRFVDFGNSESVGRSTVKDLPPELDTIPPLAILCRLQGKPLLTDEEVGLLKTETEDKELVAEVLSSNEPFEILLSDESGSKIFPPAELDKIPVAVASKTDTSQMSSKMPKAQVALGNTEGYVTEVDRSGTVYLQLASDEDKLAEMTDKLQSYSGDFTAGKFPIANTEVGEECCAMFSDDGAWYRAVVTSKTANQTTVRFVDFGNSETFSDVSRLQAIPSDLIHTPAFALGCKLNISPNISSDEKPILIELTDGKCLSVVFLSTVEPFEIRLEDEDACDIVEKLRPPTEVLLTPSKDRSPITKAYPIQEVPQGRVQGYVTQIEMSGLIFVQLQKDEDQLAAFADHVQELAHSFVNLQPVTLDAPCCAKFSEDDLWYRASVLETGPPVKVRFVDYGNLDSTDSVKDIPDELLRVAPYVLTCKLKGCQKLKSDEVEILTLQTQDKIVSIQFLSKTAPFEIALMDSNGVQISALDDSASVETSAPVTGSIVKAEEKSADADDTDAPRPTFKKQIVPSTPVVAFVTSVDEDGIFHLQLGDDTERIELLAESLQTLSAGFSEIRDSVEVGQICCTKFAEDDQWYRATVTQISGGDAVVRFVDYGNPDTVPIELLRAVPPALLKDVPFSFPCRLSGCGQLTKDEVAKFREITEEETLLATFESTGEPYEINLKTSDGALVLSLMRDSDSEMLTTNEKAESCQAAQVAEPTESGTEAVDEGFKEMAFQVDSREEVYVSHVDSPDSFWCHPVQLETQLTEMMDSIGEYCGQLTEAERGTSSSLPAGMPCLAKFSEDEGWYRAKVISTGSEGYEVLFVDYGNTEMVANTDIVTMKAEYMELPAQAVWFSLAGVQRPAEGWSTEVTEKFTAVTADKKLLAEIKGQCDINSGTKFSVQLLDMGINITSQLEVTETNVCEAVEVLETVGQSQINQRLLSVESDMDSLQLTDSLRVQVSDSLTALSETAETSEESQFLGNTITDSFRHIPLTEGSRIEVTVSHSENPSEFWIQMKEHKAELEVMMELLHETYCSMPAEESSATLQPGQPCAALFADDEGWYRGIVQEMDPAENKVSVFYVDYGNTETVERSEVRKLQPDFMALPVQAIECGLSGVRCQGALWTEEAKSKFEELVLEKNLVATILGVGEDGDCIVELLDMGISISAKMIEHGLGVNPHTPIPTPPHLRKVFSDQASVIEETEPKSDEDTTSEGFETPPSGKEDEIATVSDTRCYPRLNPTVGQEMKVYISHADSPSDFWCQPSTSSKKLEEVMARLQEQYTESTSSEQDQPQWAVDDLCAAMFTEDQQYYRAKVISSTDGSFQVFFVDHGNKEAVTSSELKALPDDLLTLEAQGLHCALSAVKPDSGDWEVSSCSRFDELTYQKELSIRVTGLGGSSGVLSVNLYDGELSIGDSLISEGYAVKDSSVEAGTLDIQADETADSPELHFHSCVSSLAKTCDDSLVDPVSITQATPTDREFREDLDSAMLGAVSQTLNVFETQATPTDREFREDLDSAMLGAVSQTLSVFESTPSDGDKVLSDSTTDACRLSPIARSEDGDAGASTIDVDDLMCSTIQLRLNNFHYLELDVGSEVLVHVCNVTDPSNFGMQPLASSTELEKLMADIAEYMETEEGAGSPIDELREGSPCLVQFSEDDQWYRAGIDSINGGEYKVTFVDYGNSELRAVTHIRNLPSSMLELPAQYISCCLADIWSDGDTWRPDTITTFKEMSEDKELNARVTEKDEEGLYHIYLYDHEDHTGWSFNRYLLSKGAELIPGSDMEIELEMEETMNQELEASFQNMSMNIENSIEDSEDSSDAEDTKDNTAVTEVTGLTPQNQRDTGENDKAEEDQLVEVSATEVEQTGGQMINIGELVDIKPDESLVSFDTADHSTIENSWAVSDESSLPPEESVQLSDDDLAVTEPNVVPGQSSDC